MDSCFSMPPLRSSGHIGGRPPDPVFKNSWTAAEFNALKGTIPAANAQYVLPGNHWLLSKELWEAPTLVPAILEFKFIHGISLFRGNQSYVSARFSPEQLNEAIEELLYCVNGPKPAHLE